MVMSMPYRCQQERELGFIKVLRSVLQNLKIKESVFNLDTTEESYKYVKRYIRDNGPPLGIYNIAGGNLGVAKAISEMNVKENIVFVGHELNKNSRNLLENNKMDFVIGHDVELERVETNDNRSYHVSSQKINDILNFKATYTIKDAVNDLKEAFEKNKLPNSLSDSKYFNIKKMQEINLI